MSEHDFPKKLAYLAAGGNGPPGVVNGDLCNRMNHPGTYPCEGTMKTVGEYEDDNGKRAYSHSVQCHCCSRVARVTGTKVGERCNEDVGDEYDWCEGVLVVFPCLECETCADGNYSQCQNTGINCPDCGRVCVIESGSFKKVTRPFERAYGRGLAGLVVKNYSG